MKKIIFMSALFGFATAQAATGTVNSETFYQAKIAALTDFNLKNWKGFLTILDCHFCYLMQQYCLLKKQHK